MSNANNDTEDPETQVEPTSESIDTNNDDNNNITCDTNNNQPRSRSSLVGPPRTVTEGETSSEDDDKSELVLREESWITMDSDLRDPSRRICIVTTAALPWRTGTAVNPLMRALYLTRGRPKHYVTLVIPFLDNLDDRVKTLGEEYRDMSTQQEQEAWIRDFCRERAGCPGKNC